MKYNPYPEIKLPFGKDNRWFAYLFDSILRVDSSFIEYTVKVKEGGELCNSDTIAHLERVFAYELYRQWMNCLEKNGVKNLVVNGEVGKYLKNELEACEPNDKKGKDNYPDLVLHKSQGSDEQQIMICEIKRKGANDSDLLRDLYKLNCFLNEEVFWKKTFDYGVFILEGKKASLDDLKIKPGTTAQFKDKEISIDSYLEDEKKKGKFPRILCVSYDGININYETLDNLANSIIKDK